MQAAKLSRVNLGHSINTNSNKTSLRARRRTAMLSLAVGVSLAGAGLARADSEVIGWNTVNVSQAVNPFNATTVDPNLGGVAANIGLNYGGGIYS